MLHNQEFSAIWSNLDKIAILRYSDFFCAYISAEGFIFYIIQDYLDQWKEFLLIVKKRNGLVVLDQAIG